MDQTKSQADLRYPIGQFNRDDATARSEHIKTIAETPTKLSKAVAGLSDAQLDTPYRPEGWTLRQTVHHVADSHINSLCRFKLALTEDEAPTIRPYYEDRWAELGDSRLPVDVSLAIVDGVHRRWVSLLESMSDADYQREFIHPETGRWTLEKVLALYAWHSRHHIAHITSSRERLSW